MKPKKHYEQRVLWKGGKTPEAPDYVGAAKAQGAAELQAQREATAANRVNQYNPWGSVTWQQAPGTFDQAGYDAAMAAYKTPSRSGGGFMKSYSPFTGSAPNRNDFMSQGNWTQTTSLDPAEQAKLDSQRGIETGLMGSASSIAGRVGEGYANPFSLDGAPAAGRAGFDVTKEYQDAIMSRLAPDLLRQRQRQEAQLIAQGVGGNTNSEAWDRAQQDLGRNEIDASMQALLKGYDVSNTEFDKSNVARNNWINEQTMMRDRPMDELLNVLRGVSPVQNPNFGSFAQQGVANAPDLAGATGAQYGAAMDKYNAKQAQNSQTMSTVGTIAGIAAVAI